MFYSASAFNQNIAGWNVLRVTTLTGAFESTAHADCYKRGIYSSWGSTLQAAYPSWGSLSLCTARCAMLDARACAHACACTVDGLLCAYLYRKLLATYPRLRWPSVLGVVDVAVTPHIVCTARRRSARRHSARRRSKQPMTTKASLLRSLPASVLRSQYSSQQPPCLRITIGIGIACRMLCEWQAGDVANTGSSRRDGPGTGTLETAV